MGNSCYATQFTLFHGQKGPTTDETPPSKTSAIAISNVINTERTSYSTTVDLFAILDPHEIDSYFEEAIYFLDFQNLKESSKVEASYFNSQFDAMQSIWYRLEDDCVNNKLHTVYSETEFGFQPELAYFLQMHELKNKMPNNVFGCVQENLAFAVKDDVLLSADKIISPKAKGSSELLTYILLRGVKRIGQSNYIEFQKSLVFTSLTSHPKLWELFKTIKNPGLVHLNCSRTYSYKGKFFRRAFAQFDIGHNAKIDLQSGSLSSLILAQSDSYLQSVANFSISFKRFSEIKWPDCLLKNVKEIFNKSAEYFNQKGVKFREMTEKPNEGNSIRDSKSNLITTKIFDLEAKKDADKQKIGSDRILLNSIAVEELQKKLEQSLLSGFETSTLSFADDKPLDNSLLLNNFTNKNPQIQKTNVKSENEINDKPQTHFQNPSKQTPATNQVNLGQDSAKPKPYKPQLQSLPKKTDPIPERSFDFQYVKNADLLIDFTTRSPNTGLQTTEAKRNAFARKKETETIGNDSGNLKNGSRKI
jgi:hypothetical protein